MSYREDDYEARGSSYGPYGDPYSFQNSGPSHSPLRFPIPTSSQATCIPPWSRAGPSVPPYDPLIHRPQGPSPGWMENVPPQFVWTDRSYRHSYDHSNMSHSYIPPSRSAGRDYLASLSTSMAGLSVEQRCPEGTTYDRDKPLPRLPPPPDLPPRPQSETVTLVYPTIDSPRSNKQRVPRPSSEASIEFIAQAMSSPPRTKVSRIPHSQSDQAITRKAKLATSSRSRLHPDVADFIVPDSDDSSGNPPGPHPNITDRSPQRRRRATSEQPQFLTTKAAVSAAPSSPSIRCAGFTRKGAPCQRLVKTAAPYLALLDMNASDAKRYCKDHAGMICDVDGFYWRGKNVWIEFDRYIPAELSLQTKALLRTTMESPLTDKLCAQVPGCRHTPTLRDIFPTPSNVSFLPGAFQDAPTIPCRAVKRWEKLVHLELADRSASTAPGKLELVREKCDDCQAVHREIFPLGTSYETVKDVIRRWERFVTVIT
ncbi:hypothetical protein BD324DRAFT_651935 [Kockovaella imperatae]|uniref:Bacteriophage T5 Orf172 DNA-binding domain-containing protein n=1 Tax=Kockovaella imperatae TaxID=4999 RepID=A0A1Y1UDB5_9TREE|nr:hypothetical protein BD324DRAFT_651935 [Kockovaella imperatae]ORX36030.1 hypothetical protein BD324DRAFT_651935 [Kockovaella imperatae]